MSLKSRARTAARGHPRLTYVTAHRLRSVRLAAAATRLLQAADIVTIDPPGGRSFAMQRAEGRDQIANAFGTDGWHAFERPLPDVFAGLVGASDGLIVDIGANSGFYALLAVAVSPAVRVVAFEPYPPAIELLRDNLRLNAEDRVDVREVALGRDSGVASLHIPDPEHGLLETSASLNHAFRDEGLTTAIDVRVSTLDDELATATDVDVLKIDVESTEADVLAGGEAVIAAHRPVIVLEVLHVTDLAPLESFRSRHDYVDLRLREDEVVVAATVEFDEHAWNHVWAPADRVDEIIEHHRSRS